MDKILKVNAEVTSYSTSDLSALVFCDSLKVLVPELTRLLLSPGINEQGLYRIVGVNSRVQKLLSLAMGKQNLTLFYLRIKSVSSSTIKCVSVHQIQRRALMWSWNIQSGRLRLSQVQSSTISGVCV